MRHIFEEANSLRSTRLIYFVHCPSASAIKIGIAQDPARRLRTLQASNPAPLKLIAAMHGTLSDERALHKRFAGERIHGEWFRDHRELRALIRRARTR